MPSLLPTCVIKIVRYTLMLSYVSTCIVLFVEVFAYLIISSYFICDIRFVRDYMRYKDEIQCAGHTLVQAVRQEAREAAPHSGGEYYALHIRRGDFQFKVRVLHVLYVRYVL